MTVNLTKIDNGIRIATEQIKNIESVSIIILINVGSRNEFPEINGISHFLEHMAFKGTAKRTAKMIAEEFDSIGGYFNAYTSRENTVFSVKILKNDYLSAIDILSDILQNSIFAEDEIEKELSVITQEIAANSDSPDEIIFDNWQNAAYPDQAIGRSILGSAETISRFNNQSFKDYTKKYYSCENTIISIVSDVDHKEIVKIIEDKFTLLSNNSLPTIEKANYQGGYNYEYRKLEQSHLVLGFETCSYLSNEIYPLHLFTTIFGGGISSRLFQEIREKLGLCYSIEGFFSSYIDIGNFIVYAGAEDKNIIQILEIIAHQAKEMINNITQNEIDRAFTQAKANILMSNENYLYKAEEIAKSILYYGRYISNRENIDLLRSVKKDNISDLIKKIFSSNPSIALVGKKDLGAQYDNIKNIFKI